MTRKKLSEWLNEQGFKTTPEQIVTTTLSQTDAECGAHPLWINFDLDGSSLTYNMSCLLNLRQITQELKNGYELKVTTNKWSYRELTLIKK